jgi:type VI secretion system secreted protein VgrG
MDALMRNTTDALRRLGARLTRHLRLWIGGQAHDLDVLDFKTRGVFCKDYIGRCAGLQVDERVAVLSASHVNPVDQAAANFNGMVTRWNHVRTGDDEAAARFVSSRASPRSASAWSTPMCSAMSPREDGQEAVAIGQNFDAFNVRE